MKKEVWKDIPGYEGKYLASTFGRIRSLNFKGNTGKTIILKTVIKKKTGYVQVSLSKNGKPKKYLVHRLIALTFIDNPNNYPIINHKDEDKTNNNVDNLEWCTIKYNITYGTAIERNKIKRSTPVYCYKGDTLIKVYKSIQDTKYDGHKPTHVSRCCRGKMFYHHGFQWRYANKR